MWVSCDMGDGFKACQKVENYSLDSSSVLSALASCCGRRTVPLIRVRLLTYKKTNIANLSNQYGHSHNVLKANSQHNGFSGIEISNVKNKQSPEFSDRLRSSHPFVVAPEE